MIHRHAWAGALVLFAAGCSSASRPAAPSQPASTMAAPVPAQPADPLQLAIQAAWTRDPELADRMADGVISRHLAADARRFSDPEVRLGSGFDSGDGSVDDHLRLALRWQPPRLGERDRAAARGETDIGLADLACERRRLDVARQVRATCLDLHGRDQELAAAQAALALAEERQRIIDQLATLGSRDRLDALAETVQVQAARNQVLAATDARDDSRDTYRELVGSDPHPQVITQVVDAATAIALREPLDQRDFDIDAATWTARRASLDLDEQRSRRWPVLGFLEVSGRVDDGGPSQGLQAAVGIAVPLDANHHAVAAAAAGAQAAAARLEAIRQRHAVRERQHRLAWQRARDAWQHERDLAQRLSDDLAAVAAQADPLRLNDLRRTQGEASARRDARWLRLLHLASDRLDPTTAP